MQQSKQRELIGILLGKSIMDLRQFTHIHYRCKENKQHRIKDKDDNFYKICLCGSITIEMQLRFAQTSRKKMGWWTHTIHIG